MFFNWKRGEHLRTERTKNRRAINARPVFIGDFCALVSRQRKFGADRLAERDEPESNTLRFVEN